MAGGRCHMGDVKRASCSALLCSTQSTYPTKAVAGKKHVDAYKADHLLADVWECSVCPIECAPVTYLKPKCAVGHAGMGRQRRLGSAAQTCRQMRGRRSGS
jgi:hypothetical protein